MQCGVVGIFPAQRKIQRFWDLAVTLSNSIANFDITKYAKIGNGRAREAQEIMGKVTGDPTRPCWRAPAMATKTSSPRYQASSTKTTPMMALETPILGRNLRKTRLKYMNRNCERETIQIMAQLWLMISWISCTKLWLTQHLMNERNTQIFHSEMYLMCRR